MSVSEDHVGIYIDCHHDKDNSPLQRAKKAFLSFFKSRRKDSGKNSSIFSNLWENQTQVEIPIQNSHAPVAFREDGGFFLLVDTCVFVVCFSTAPHSISF